MKAFHFIITVGILLVVSFTFLPFVSISDGYPTDCSASIDGTSGACAPLSHKDVVFPVLRTVACEAWHRPACAVDTLLPGWYDTLIHPLNVLLALAYTILSIFGAYRFQRICNTHGHE